MSLMKQTLQLLVSRAGLNGDDRISLVTFDSSVKLELPLVSMDKSGQDKAQSVVKGLHPGATTNLSGGALKAIDVLDASEQHDAGGRTRAVMLFTDGLANEGIRDTASLVSAVSGALSSASKKVGGPISLFTFGFGSDHNEECLRALATSSGAGGLYYYVSAADDIPNAFADCLGGLTSVVAQNATLALSGRHGASVVRVLGTAYTRDAEGALVLGDLFAEDEKDVLVELALPKLDAPADSTQVLQASLRCFNVARSAPEVTEVTLEVARPACTPANQTVNTLLDAQRNRIETAEALEKASQLADAGNVEGGRALLLECRKRVKTSSSAAHQLSANLVDDIDSVEQHYQSRNTYRTVGSKMSKMSSLSHSRQRAVHTNADMYTSAASNKRAMKARWMSTIDAAESDSD